MEVREIDNVNNLYSKTDFVIVSVSLTSIDSVAEYCGYTLGFQISFFW